MSEIVIQDENSIRKEILDKVKDIYNVRKESEKFIEGKTKIHYSGRVFDENEMIAVVDSALDFWLTLGRKSIDFTNAFKNFLGIKNCLVTNSGSSANLIAVSSLCSRQLINPLNDGDEVITTAVTFPTTLNPIIQNNLKPVFVDVEQGTYNIDPKLIEKSITDKTRAIIFAHTLGNPADMDAIMEIAKKNKLYVIEDTCDALGSTYDGKYCGTFGDFSTYSFYAAHHITMGEGGAICTNNIELSRIALSIRDWGRACYCQQDEKNPNGACNHRFDFKFGNMPEGYDHKYIYTNIGYNLKPLDIQCAMGIKQLEKLPVFIQKRKENFKKLYNCLKKYEDKVILPKSYKKADPAWFSFPITVRDNVGFTRRDFVRFLESRGIETRMLFAGNILNQPAYKNINHKIIGELSNSSQILSSTFFIGVYPGITTEMMNYMISAIEDFFKNIATGLKI
ncbi:lipopolysaccharide biosynthesis protein RfbH [Clostridium beijerinckii]|uniref:CDP-6-deoxy-D-xylo-4-hexulose-3-dehydrase n=1 Tax=Clostridium beijerinckii TaxID=1520 RepID=A0AAE5H680_CLOBE|nr:lipopolysaccharide biosynthesis protein RfbH [Clostridium beijerinckii]NSB14802.1 CDP-6-deoxy-D-xylo-4-hexulose-3-dehydrase [Clostridium beijerinckii]OOM24704.1 dTDP-4-amino-4,6-dideoxy-D-glucose transaminase [Clostridium beijerinckii]